MSATSRINSGSTEQTTAVIDNVQLEHPVIELEASNTEVENKSLSVLPDMKQTNDSLDRAKSSPSHIDILAEELSASTKLCELLRNFLFWNRILLLVLLIFLSFLSASYCIAQLLKAKLALITECPDPPKTRDEIWAHSYEASLKYDDANKINRETQYGYTNEACWTTKQFEVNTYQLWYSNKYEFEWHPYHINGMFVLFGLVSLFCVSIIVYVVYESIVDIKHAVRGTLHTKWRAFHYDQTPPEKQKEHVQTNAKLKRCGAVCLQYYFKYLSQDTTGWIIRKFSSEVSEIMLQSIALWLYNGYHLFDPHNERNTYLAVKPQFINLLASWIAFNSFGSGILWLFYSTMSDSCYGLKFKRLLFFVDKFSDFLYIIFPFVVLLYDDYNEAAADDYYAVLLAQLKIDSALAFFAAFVPLFLLSVQCLLIAHSTINRLRKHHFDQFVVAKQSAMPISPKSMSSVHDQSPSDQETETSPKTNREQSESKRREWDKNWIHKNSENKPRQKHIKRGVVICLSAVLITYGIFLIVFVTKHTQNAKHFCQSVADSVEQEKEHWSDQLRQNPELFAWNHCLYKVYPFVNEDKYRCQCRVFVMEDWSQYQSTYDQRVDSSFNLTQHEIIHGALQHWFMLEKFRSSGTEAPVYQTYSLNASIYNARHMKAFEWSDARMSYIEDGISHWKKLEYLKIDATLFLPQLPGDIGELTQMKILQLNQVGLTEFPNAVCNMTQLLSLQITGNNHIEGAVPHCIANLVHAKEIAIDSSRKIDAVPLSLFNMDNLIDLSLFEMNLTYGNLLAYNLPSDIDNSTTDEWFNDNFVWNNHTTYWLHNTLCEYNWYEWSNLPSALQEFGLSDNVECDKPCWQNVIAINQFLCYPRNWGDGKCDFYCTGTGCSFDGGDCMQLCFSELTNCSYNQDITIMESDPQCIHSEYCAIQDQRDHWFSYGRTLSSSQDTMNNISETACVLSSDYVASSAQDTLNIAMNQRFNERQLADYICYPQYLGDGLCQDVCRTEECGFDADDCSLQCRQDWCAGVYTFWIDIVGIQKYVGFADLCRELTVTIGWNPWESPMLESAVDCIQMLPIVDLNGDDRINYKEFVTMLQVIGTVWGYVDFNTALTVNCSWCVGTDEYNAMYIA